MRHYYSFFDVNRFTVLWQNIHGYLLMILNMTPLNMYTNHEYKQDTTTQLQMRTNEFCSFVFYFKIPEILKQ